MCILAIEREQPVPPPQNPHDLLRDDAKGLWELHQRGIVRDLWLASAGRRTVIILECAGLIEAHAHLNALPRVRAGLAEFLLLELRPYDGFAHLFAGGTSPTPPPPEEPPEY